jgi:uncharacterized protein (DUF1810 family)
MYELNYQDDPFELARFLSIQEIMYPIALGELNRGRKESPWMWFIFPQIDGLGNSGNAIYYGIKSIDEAKGYLEHPKLGTRLIECCNAILKIQGRSALDIFGFPDEMKLRSSMTLFSSVQNDPDFVFNQVLKKYFEGKPDQKTIALLRDMFGFINIG